VSAFPPAPCPRHPAHPGPRHPVHPGPPPAATRPRTA